MNKSEMKRTVEWANTLSDQELVAEYHTATSLMPSYKKSNIDNYSFEKWLQDFADILRVLCEERGIKLWDACRGE